VSTLERPTFRADDPDTATRRPASDASFASHPSSERPLIGTSFDGAAPKKRRHAALHFVTPRNADNALGIHARRRRRRIRDPMRARHARVGGGVSGVIVRLDVARDSSTRRIHDDADEPNATPTTPSQSVELGRPRRRHRRHGTPRAVLGDAVARKR